MKYYLTVTNKIQALIAMKLANQASSASSEKHRIVSFYSYHRFRIVKTIQTESRLEVARVQATGEWGVITAGFEVLFGMTRCFRISSGVVQLCEYNKRP
jgi:hypothetical protein